MRSTVVKRLIVMGATLALPMTVFAQEATVSGTVTDATGGVLPGVTVTAVHEASGNTFVAVTDERGEYRLPVRTGIYRIAAELQGFATLTRSGLELLVGQQAVMNLQMSPSGVQESVTVTGESPLIDVTQSSLGGNIDPRQMQELPLNGRNWMDLVVLAPGNRQNAVTADSPAVGTSGFTPVFQLNIDGQQVTQIVGPGHGQAHYSRDAIAEFEFISNRFDATQGRSSGVQVNAVTKSGTNTPSGTLSGYFRDDRFNAADFIQRRVLPYANQQVSATFGGPIRKDKIHFFGNYEYEREPQTFAFNSPFPRFNSDISGTRREHRGGGRFDFQFSSQTRLAVRGNKNSHLVPHDPRNTGGATQHPSVTATIDRFTNDLFVTLTQVLSNRALNVVKGGYTGFYWDFQSYTKWANHPKASIGVVTGGPRINFRGYSIGGNIVIPQRGGQDNYSVRDDFTYSFAKGGRHDLKLGGEYLYTPMWQWFCINCMGVYDAQGGPIPANIEDLFPDPWDASTWNLAALSPIVRTYTVGIGNFGTYVRRHVYGAWVQDDWAITQRLTLNLGLRYDLTTGAFANAVELQPFLRANRPNDTNNLAPRLGFAYSVNDRTVLRGGFGRYFAEVTNQPSNWAQAWSQQVHPQVANDGRPDFASNPFNGPAPTFAQVIQSGVRRAITSQLVDPNAQIPYSYQTSIGVQRQLGNTMAVEADYVFTGSRHILVGRNINLSYNPATGVNYPFTDVSKLPYPDWGVVSMTVHEGRSDYHALQTAFTKRLSQRWQASGTYTLAGLWDEVPPPVKEFKVAPDLGGEWTLAAGDQRHRAVVNGIWQLGYGFQLSGLYFFGSGERFSTTYGGDLRLQGVNAESRLRPDGTIVPRNNFVGKPIHRLDLRVQRRFPLGGRAGIDGIVEVFNLFNHENYGSYVTVESNRNYGRPTQNTNVAYQPRILQLGFRFAF